MSWGDQDSKTIVEQNTVTITKGQRDHAVGRVRRARRTLGGTFRTGKRSTDEAILAHHVKNAKKYGDYILKPAWNGPSPFPAVLTDRLSTFGNGTSNKPFLLIRGLYPRPYFWFDHPAKINLDHDPERGSSDENMTISREWYLRQGYYEMLSSAIFSFLGTVHQPKLLTDKHIYRNYFTARESMIDQFSNDADLPMRFRTAVPEGLFADDQNATVENMTARYAIYTCVQNPIQDPIWLLETATIVELLTPEEKSILQSRQFWLFDHWRDELDDRERGYLQPVVDRARSAIQNQEFISFDANRVHIDRNDTTSLGRSAIATLRWKIQQAAAEHAICVDIKRGDALLIDNYKILVRRTELHPSRMPSMFWGAEPIRWLRLHCGFPPERGDINPKIKTARKADLGEELTVFPSNLPLPAGQFQ